MKKTNREGISLIVLVITIIVMLILVSAVILKLKDSYNYIIYMIIGVFILKLI